MKNLNLTTSQTESSISIGSTVYGAANIGCKVLEINGDTLTVATTDGKMSISVSRVARVEPPTLVDRLEVLAALDKSDAIEGLKELLTEFTTDSVYEASLDIDTYLGVFIRRLLADISAIEFAKIR